MSDESSGRDCCDLESHRQVLIGDNSGRDRDCDCDRDLESLQRVALLRVVGDNVVPRDHWSWIISILRARKTLARVLRAKRNRPSSLIASDSPEEECSELKGTVRPVSPEVSVDIHSGGNFDDIGTNKRLQHENIARIVKTKDYKSLHEFGGVQGIAEALDTDLDSGIPADDDGLACRRSAFPLISETHEDPEQGFFYFLLEACKSYTIFLLLVCALLSVGFGIKEEGPSSGWYEGALIVAGLITLVFVHSMNNFWYAQTQKLSERSELIVHVFRAGCELPIGISNVVLGDIVCLKAGHQVLADGLFISGESLKTDNNEYDDINHENPFLFYGEKIVTGDGRMLVTSLGKDTLWGEMMSEVTGGPTKKTLLHVQLDKVNTCTQIIGLLITILILVILFLRFNFGKEGDNGPGFPDLKEKPGAIKEFMDAIENIVRKPKGKISILTAALTMLLVGMAEGLPFVVILAIFYWNKKILSGKGTVQDFLACIGTASATTICIDKASGLTLLDQMEVDMFFIGEDFIGEETVIPPDVCQFLCKGIGTLALTMNVDDPLLSWASLKLGTKMDAALEQQCPLVDAKESNPNNGHGILTRSNIACVESTGCHCKGPATTILATCSRYYESRGEIKVINEKKRTEFEKFIEDMSIKHLKTIAYAYREVDVQTPEENLILLGLVGLKHSCRKAIEACITAGMNIKLVSGDNVFELEAIAQECGILVHNLDAVVLGENFRNSTEKERMDMVDRIHVMGNCHPSDRLLLVKCLKQKGHVVAVVGARTDESPALKEADVGIALGSLSTEKAKESSDIVVSDGNFNFVVTIMKCGRCAHGNIRKFLQLQLTMSISWFLINPITTSCFGDAPISAIESVWVYMMVTILGGLALLTEPPSNKVMEEPPASKSDPLITRAMWRNIALQTCYQVSVLLTFRFKGEAILGINQKIIKTMMFNSFVLCQVFNQFNAREPELKNVVKGIFQNCWFWSAIGVTVVFQVAFMEIAHVLTGDVRLTCSQWGVCLLIGMVSWLLDWIGKCTANFITGWFTKAPTSDTGYIGLTFAGSSDSVNSLDTLLE